MRYDEALAQCNRDIELDPEDALAIASRGETYRRMQRYDEALADFNRAIELKPGYARAIAIRGQVCRAMQHRERIAHVQVADAPGRGAPGTGTLDFEPLFARLAAQGYTGSVGLEYVPSDPADSATSFGWLEAPQG